jgi:predicted RNase H-like nuclease (RuvC/YqgF family)
MFSIFGKSEEVSNLEHTIEVLTEENASLKVMIKTKDAEIEVLRNRVAPSVNSTP